MRIATHLHLSFAINPGALMACRTHCELVFYRVLETVYLFLSVSSDAGSMFSHLTESSENS